MDLLVDMEVQCTLASNMVGNNSMADLHTEAGTVGRRLSNTAVGMIAVMAAGMERRHLNKVRDADWLANLFVYIVDFQLCIKNRSSRSAPGQVSGLRWLPEVLVSSAAS